MRDRCARHSRRTAPAVVVLILLIATGACGNLTPGGIGEATVAVTGNEPSPQPAPSSSYAAAYEPIAPTSHDDDDEADEAEGEVEVEFLVSLVSENGSEVQLGGLLRVRVDLQGVEEAPVVTQLIPAVRYTELRLVFTEIEVEVEGGLLINGLPFTGDIEVDLEDISLLVTRPIDLDVGHGQKVLLVIDLNAPAWLTAVDPILLTVDETVFASFINVVIP